jgi:hypothetical protein
MSISQALELAGYTPTLRLAAGEILDRISTQRFVRHSDRTEGALRRTKPMTFEALNDYFEELATGPARNLTPELHMEAGKLIELLQAAQVKLVEDGILRLTVLDGESSLKFAIDPLLCIYSSGDPTERQAARVHTNALRQITTIPRGTIFTSTGKIKNGQLQRAVNIQVHNVSGWSISRYRGMGDKVDWSPPALSYAGTGGYWRDVYAVGPLAELMARALEETMSLQMA